MSPLRARLAKHEIRAELEAQGLDGQWLADTLEGETRLDEALLNLAEVVADRKAQVAACKARVAADTAALPPQDGDMPPIPDELRRAEGVAQ